MPLADVTNTHHHRSANSHIVVAPLQKRVSSATSTTATKLTDMFGKKSVSSAAASSSSKTDEEEDFFASCAKDEAVVRKGTAPFCFTRLFLLLLSYLYVVSMRHKRARARQLFTSLFFSTNTLSNCFSSPSLVLYQKKCKQRDRRWRHQRRRNT